MDAPQQQIDSRALEIATEARTMIQAHVRECAETRQEILRKFDESKVDREKLYHYIKSKTDGLNRLVWNGAVGLIFLLLTIIGYFLATDGLPSHQQPLPAPTHLERLHP